jgi:hypothetical protein
MRIMFTIYAVAETSASPRAVIDAARDFSPRRAEIWPNVTEGHFEVHASGDAFIEATEFLWPLGFYERCRYEWPRPDQVCATVLESNAVEPGSTWELTAVPLDGDGGGTRVETVFQREFPRTARGRIAKALNHMGGRRLMPSDLRHALAEIEKQEA